MGSLAGNVMLRASSSARSIRSTMVFMRVLFQWLVFISRPRGRSIVAPRLDGEATRTRQKTTIRSKGVSGADTRHRATIRARRLRLLHADRDGATQIARY